MNSISEILDWKRPYESTKYYSLEHKGNSFFINTLEYFLFNIPLIILLVLSMRLLLKFSKKLQNFNILKIYNFAPIFIILLFEGNYQMFSYYFFSDMLSLFNFGFNTKCINVTLVSMLFGFIFISTTLYFLLKIFYGEKSFRFF